MLETDPTATVDDLEHDFADLDEVELPLEHQNGGSAQAADEEAATAISVSLPDAALGGYIVARRREIAAEVGTALD